MQTIIITILVLGIAMAGFAVRLFFVKDAEVRGGCAGKNPLLRQDGVACGVCGQVPSVEGCGDQK